MGCKIFFYSPFFFAKSFFMVLQWRNKKVFFFSSIGSVFVIFDCNWPWLGKNASILRVTCACVRACALPTKTLAIAEGKEGNLREPPSLCALFFVYCSNVERLLGGDDEREGKRARDGRWRRRRKSFAKCKYVKLSNSSEVGLTEIPYNLLSFLFNRAKLSELVNG